MASKTSTCLKVFLIVVNFLFLTVGIAILAVGIYLCTSANLGKFSEVFAGLDTLRSVRYILIGSGAFIMLVALCGFFGACKENRCLIILYLLFLVAILIANVAAVALALLYNGKVKTYVLEEVKDRLKHQYGNDTDASVAFTKGIDAIQREEKCCGWTGLNTGMNFFTSTPWFQSQPRDKPRNSYPESCCSEGSLADIANKKAQCVQAKDEALAREKGHIHEEDCSDKLVALNSKFMGAVLGTVIVAILLQLICITCSIVIVRQISSDAGGRMV